MLRGKGRRSWALIAVGLILALVLGFRAIMGRVCGAAKAEATQKHLEPPFFAGTPPMLNIAHRGASAEAPEHSVAAYELALAQGADVLELDLRQTRDGALVVAHDADLRRTHGLEVTLREIEWEELVALTGERSPFRLEDVLAKFPDARFNLELKDEQLEAARALAELLARADAGRRVLVASAHHAVMAEFRRAAGPAVATSASAREVLRYHFCQLMNRSCPAPFVALQVPPITWLGLTRPAFVRAAHERGVRVHYWTVDEEEAQRRLIALGADGIMTNRPERLSRLLDRALEATAAP